jgi:hypothetical protein
METLAAARVPAEQQADRERTLADEDVAGFATSITDGTSNTFSFGDAIRGARPAGHGTAFTGGVFVSRTLTLLPYVEQDN